MRSGYVILREGFVKRAGLFAHYWSSSILDADTIYNLNITDLGVYPSVGPHLDYFGFSLRCLQE